MGGGNNETTTESNPWAPAQGHITSGLDWAQQIVQNQATNIPQMGQLGPNANLTGAWAGMSGPGMTNLANQFGQFGSQMMGQFDAGALKDIYSELGQGPSLYNQQAQRDALMADKMSVLNDQNAAIMSGLDKALAQSSGQIYGAAAGGGNVGSSRTQLAQGQAAGNLGAQAQAQMTNLQSQAFDTASQQAMANEQARLSGLGQQAAGMMGMAQAGQAAMGQAGNIYQQALQNQLTAGQGQLGMDQYNAMVQYQNAMNAWQAPQNLVGWYSGLAQGAGSMGGTTTSTAPNNNFMNGLMGMGSSFLGSNAGSAAVVGMFSDKRLKDNIKRVSYDLILDVPMYQWDWNENADELKARGYGHMIGANSGYIAQEVQEKYPNAVKEHESGYLFIDYKALLEEVKEMLTPEGAKPVFDGKWLTPIEVKERVKAREVK